MTLSTSNSGISQALPGITDAKINDLSNLCTKIQELKTKLVELLELVDDRTERLLILRVGIRACHSLKTSKLSQPVDCPPQDADDPLPSVPFHETLESFIYGTQHDPSISDAAFEDWEKRALSHLESIYTKLNHTFLHAKLTKEVSCSSNTEPIAGKVTDSKAQSAKGAYEPRKSAHQRRWEPDALSPIYGVDSWKLYQF
ncbi:hypothetical protein PG993_011805 [Apiospora rasikravindrae]|uniref:Uncharacterized protein n=1 Tax=Apiospora rasikravindrae TaxID=990691 RepID=A0ABR1S0P2_9PEZI